MTDLLIATRENIRFAAGALAAHKLRSTLTILGIVIGVTTVIAMVSIIEGFSNSVIRSFQSFGATLVQFQKYDVETGPNSRRDENERLRKNLTYEDALALKRLCPSMAAVSPERYYFPPAGSQTNPSVVYGGQDSSPDTIAGVTEDYPTANNKSVSEGRFINEGDVRRSAPVVVLGYEVGRTLFPNSDPIGRIVTFSGRKYSVIGVMEKEGESMFESTDLHFYMPLTTLDLHYPYVKRESGVNIATVPRDPLLVNQLIEEGTTVLRARRRVPFNKPNDFGIMTPEMLIRSFKQITGGIALAMIFIASIALLVGGVGVMNIMLVSVTERTREIGIRKAIGAVRRDIVQQFLTEAMTLSGIGGLIGVGIGLGIAALVRALSPLAAETPLWSIMVGLLVSISIGLFFGIYPAYKAARLDPVEALRYE